MCHGAKYAVQFPPSCWAIKMAATDSGLPDGIFSNQKSRFGLILEGLAMQDVNILYGRLVFFTTTYLIYVVAIWYILGLFCYGYGYFLPFRYVVSRKIWQPW
jgi:hypothetical protein